MSDLNALLAQLRELSRHVPALADILSQVDKPKRERKPKRIHLSSRPLNMGKYAGIDSFNRYDHAEREPLPATKRERLAQADRYRARIDASAEAEGEAIDRLDTLRDAGIDLLERAIQWSTSDDTAASRIVRRFHAGNTGRALSHVDYVRALASAALLDTSDRMKRGEMSLILRRYDYRRSAAQSAWDRICEYYARRTRGEILPPPALLSRLPGWARQTQENAQTRARRQLQKQWRELVRIIGKAKIAGIAGADELYAQVSTMQPLA